MPVPRRIARFNRRVTNRLTLKVAPYLPGFGVVSHVGRRSGRVYHTPVNVFRRDDSYLVALTYGAESDWVRNVMAAGQCEIQTMGRHVRLCNPRMVTDETLRWAPFPVRFILGRLHAYQYLLLQPCP